MTSPVFWSAAEAAAAIRERRISASELCAAYLDQIARHNPRLNAIVTLDADAARVRAHAADRALASGEVWGPLHGVPVTIKDSLEVAGMRTTSGYSPLADHVPEHDATVVARIRQAGAIILGKTNLPPLAGNFQTDNPLFGRSANPWNLEHTPGGSTGGGAAALAAGLSALEIGSDIGGSVRNPAHYCGVYAIKPTDNLVSRAGHIPELPGVLPGIRHMGVMGPIARSVDDLELALTLIAGPDGRRWEVPPVPLIRQETQALPSLRIAWTDTFGLLPTEETRRAITALAVTLERAGCHIERREPAGFDFESCWLAWGELFEAEVGSTMSDEDEDARLDLIGARLDSDDPLARGIARGAHATMRAFASALNRRDVLIGSLEALLGEFDALICPVTATPAIAHQPTGDPIRVDDRGVPYWLAGLAHCTPLNLTGHPAVVLPLTRSSSGLPIGVQVVGRRWGDMSLLAVCRAVDSLIGRVGPPPGC
ncbi:amidase [Candidatus Poribacteria bacterium]|nr:amidase [Candidatus Poribacteria bacterium]